MNATWTVTSLWNTGFVANYKITNSAATQLTDWTVEFDLPADESVTTVWGGELDQSGKHYVLTPEDYNHTVAPGGSISVGFQAALTGAYTAPVNCVINGEPCSDGSVPQGESATPAATVTASSGTQICDQFGTTTVAGSYVVQNNRWGSNAAQCIDVAGSGFSIAKQDGSVATDGAPLSYPSIYLGCHDNNCSPGSSLPTQLNQIRAANSSISYGYTDGTYDAAYDIWLDPTPKKDGVNQMEIMIWFNRQGPIQPVGSKTGSATISGRDWDVWQGNNGANKVISYVAPTPMDSWDFSVLDFTNDVRTKGLITDAWYLTSIQAGFEPWRGGVGLAVNSFSANVTH
ncbi:Chitinase 63 precursor [Mycobacterium basiliense]|uniref:Chitinase 63 n=1 Tax=Mycobacterium basiliense TaxID=2094119 RepID=A0A3S4FQL5_9MYCO|nr:cellulose binding domain-containing protein [Mycobacterium basiliense]VDM90610.1 Chitinase 63 precursor [Mycobacterium basiliense]